MSQLIEVHFTSGSLDEARRIARYLVQERLVACAQIIPWIESVYLWDQKMETAQESKVVLKTTESLYSKVEEVILQNHSYEVPELLIFPIQGGTEAYLEWLQETIKA